MSRTQAHFSLARAVFASDLSGDLARDLALITQRENTDGNDENKNTLADFIEPIAKQAKQTKNTKAQIIDIRSSQDFAKKHIKGAKNITDFESLSREILSCQDTNFLLHCYSGYTVAMIGSELVGMGAKNVFYFDESFEALCEKLESTNQK